MTNYVVHSGYFLRCTKGSHNRREMWYRSLFLKMTVIISLTLDGITTMTNDMKLTKQTVPLFFALLNVTHKHQKNKNTLNGFSAIDSLLRPKLSITSDRQIILSTSYVKQFLCYGCNVAYKYPCSYYVRKLSTKDSPRNIWLPWLSWLSKFHWKYYVYNISVIFRFTSDYPFYILSHAMIPIRDPVCVV